MIIVIVLMNATEMLHFILIILSPKKVGHFQKTGHEPNSAPSHAASRATWARLLHNETRFRQPDDSHAPSERRTRRTSGLRMKNRFHTGTNKWVTPNHETMFCQPDDFHAPSQWRRKRSSASGKKGSYSTYLYLDFHLLSRQWLLHTGGCKMFRPLFHAGMTVLTIFFRIYMSTDWRKVRSQKRLIEVENMQKKRFFSKNFLKRPTTNQEFLKCAARFVAAHFKNSPFVAAHIRNSWFVVAHFGNSWFEAGPFKKVLRESRFLACFPLLWVIFWLLTLLQSVGIDIPQKDWCKTLIPAWKRSLNILHLHGVATACRVLWQS